VSTDPSTNLSTLPFDVSPHPDARSGVAMQVRQAQLDQYLSL
jgi:hypothetical protein